MACVWLILVNHSLVITGHNLMSLRIKDYVSMTNSAKHTKPKHATNGPKRILFCMPLTEN